MPSNEQRRQAAKRKLERQLQRRAERARRRRTTAVVVTVAAVVVVVGGIYFIATAGHGNSAAAASQSSSAPTTTTQPPVTSKGACKFTTTPQAPAPTGKDVGMPDDPAKTPNTGTVQVTLKTSAGNIPVTLNRAEAPCTVQSMVHLVTSKFFDNTPCHRLTDYPKPNPLYVLQCGDPTGQGTGGPGYSIPDEKPKNLKAAPTTTPVPSGQEAPVIYPAGTLAMANSGQPHSGGSQFFLVYKDSQLPPDYTVFGTVTASGLSVLNKIAGAGLTPGTDPNSGQATPNDGKPKDGVTIKQAVVG
ncbi:MAG TPA: peptidylprolyl isomerase [Pseudonocardiaceae bacterium]|nr:peptidylprolyl isomerase [Pseudonocardiaceae bacterium]